MRWSRTYLSRTSDASSIWTTGFEGRAFWQSKVRALNFEGAKKRKLGDLQVKRFKLKSDKWFWRLFNKQINHFSLDQKSKLFSRHQMQVHCEKNFSEQNLVKFLANSMKILRLWIIAYDCSLMSFILIGRHRERYWLNINLWPILVNFRPEFLMFLS